MKAEGAQFDRIFRTQMRPGDKVRFKETTLEMAQRAYLDRNHILLSQE